MSPAEISFAIPYYDTPRFLGRAIESVRNQTIGSWRLTIYDDSSALAENPPAASVAVRAIVESFRDERISYRCNDRNLGMAGNWNQCIQEAQTDLVTLVHGDDELLPQYGEKVITAARRWPECAAVFCRARTINESGRAAFSLPDLVKRVVMPKSHNEILLEGERAIQALLRGYFVFAATLCLRKPLLGKRTFNDKWRIITDVDFVLGLIMDGGSVVGLPDVAYAYRRHGTNLIEQSTLDATRFVEEIELYDNMAELLEARRWNDAATTARAKRILKLHLCFRILREAATLQLPAMAAKIRLLDALLRGRDAGGSGKSRQRVNDPGASD